MAKRWLSKSANTPVPRMRVDHCVRPSVFLVMGIQDIHHFALTFGIVISQPLYK